MKNPMDNINWLKDHGYREQAGHIQRLYAQLTPEQQPVLRMMLELMVDGMREGRECKARLNSLLDDAQGMLERLRA